MMKILETNVIGELIVRASIIIQHLLPHHAISILAHIIANCKSSLIKNFLIYIFIKIYKVDLQEAIEKNYKNYASFNDFFTRDLETKFRPINNNQNIITSPADGTIAQIGTMYKNRIIQAKGHHFNLNDLLAGHSMTNQFTNGNIAIIYLAPHNYHLVHMPITGTLQETIFIPGRLYSVNKNSTLYIPNLFARNERLVAIFNTAIGPMAIIFVGAMIVGSITTAWENSPTHPNRIIHKNYAHKNLNYSKGDKIGGFQLGSTVIAIFAKDAINWHYKIKKNTTIKVGENIASCMQHLDENDMPLDISSKLVIN